MIKNFVRLFVIFFLFEVPAMAMLKEVTDASNQGKVKVKNTSKVIHDQHDLSDWFLVSDETFNASSSVPKKTSNVTREPKCSSDWFLVPIVKQEFSRELIINELFDVWSSENDTTDLTKKTQGDKTIPLETLGVQ